MILSKCKYFLVSARKNDYCVPIETVTIVNYMYNIRSFVHSSIPLYKQPFTPIYPSYETIHEHSSYLLYYLLFLFHTVEEGTMYLQ